MHLNQISEPPQLTLFKAEEQWIYFELALTDRTPCLIANAEPNLTTWESHFNIQGLTEHCGPRFIGADSHPSRSAFVANHLSSH